MPQRPAPTRARRRLFLVLLLLQLALVPLMAELALRWFAPVSFRRPRAAPVGSAWASLLHRRSQVPGLSYELSPGHAGEFRDVPVVINSLGLRDDEIEPVKPAGTVRIAALGDSVTFGWTVPSEQSWPNRLEARLNGSSTGARYEVLNFGVGGYSSADEAAVLVAKVLPLDPDLVIVAYHLNDPETEPIQPLHQVFHQPLWWEHVNLLRLVAWGRRLVGVTLQGGGQEYRYLHAPGGRHWPAVTQAFDRMREACAARAIPLVLVQFPTKGSLEDWAHYGFRDLHAQVLAAARERGFGTLDIEPVYVSSGHTPSALYADAEHPNALGLDLAAQAIEQLLRQGFAARLGLDEALAPR